MSEAENISDSGCEDLLIDSISTLTGFSFRSGKFHQSYNPEGLLGNNYEEGHIPNSEFSDRDVHIINHTPGS